MSNNKTCTKCGEEKPATLEYFYKQGEALRPACKVCSLKSAKAYYKANRENRIAYLEANREAIAEQKAAYQKANREAIAERKRTYSHTPKGKWFEIRAGAKQRNLDFSLSLSLYETQLWGKPCHYCGCEIEVTGLDRKDSIKGYSLDNVVPCCHDCNRKKQDKPYDQFVLEQSLSEGHNK